MEHASATRRDRARTTWVTVVIAMGLIACKWLPRGETERTPPDSVTSVGEGAKSPPPAPESSAPEQPKPGYVEVTVGGVATTDEGNVVFLLDPQQKTAVPIFIGGAEAFSIQLRLDDRRFRRPLTHDLFDAAVERLGGRIVNVRIDEIKSNTFHATLVLVRGSERHELDARSSDAIAIALGNDAPIHMAESVIKKSGVDVARLEALAKTPEEPSGFVPADEDPIKM